MVTLKSYAKILCGVLAFLMCVKYHINLNMSLFKFAASDNPGVLLSMSLATWSVITILRHHTKLKQIIISFLFWHKRMIDGYLWMQ